MQLKGNTTNNYYSISLSTDPLELVIDNTPVQPDATALDYLVLQADDDNYYKIFIDDSGRPELAIDTTPVIEQGPRYVIMIGSDNRNYQLRLFKSDILELGIVSILRKRRIRVT